MDAIERLEKWKCGHRCRCVDIDIDDGFGSSCWEVRLTHEKGTTRAIELGSNLREGVVTAGGPDEDWPGLARTIHAAIDAFEAGKWSPMEPRR